MRRMEQEILRTWIRSSLARSGKTQAELAKALGVAPPRITEILAGKRNVKVEEVSVISRYFGEPVPGASELSSGNIPVISWVSAGHFCRDDISQDIIGSVRAPDLPVGDWVALRVDGDSMDRISPPGSIIFVDKSDKKLIHNGCYIIVDEDGRATYKRYRQGPPRFEPVSVNRDYEAIYVDGEHWPEVFGRVRKTLLEM